MVLLFSVMQVSNKSLKTVPSVQILLETCMTRILSPMIFFISFFLLPKLWKETVKLGCIIWLTSSKVNNTKNEHSVAISHWYGVGWPVSRFFKKKSA